MKKIVAILVGLIIVFVLWYGFYPDRYDPKNPHYVLWKWHLMPINLDRAVSVMHHDRWSERMIIGKDENALRERFGYLMFPSDAAPCYRDASEKLVPAGDKALFLRRSDYLIIFHDGIATDVKLLNDVGPC